MVSALTQNVLAVLAHLRPSPPSPAGQHAGGTMPPETHDLNVYLPLTPAEYHILLALVGAERHGYAILKDIEDRTQGTLKLGFATLYRTIRRMVEDELLVEVEDANRAAQDDDPRRKYYRLTELGSQVLHTEALRQLQGLRDAIDRGVLSSADISR